MSTVSSYDYIVVGAGSAGCVLAAELATSGAQVLIVESGGYDDAPTIANPSIWFYNLAGPLDYHLPIQPTPRVNNRIFNMALGHVLGGGSSTNGLVWGRGKKTGRAEQTSGAEPAVPFTYAVRTIRIRLREPSWRLPVRWACPSLTI
jgi:choline dehydrogenase-like flavoprotein